MSSDTILTSETGVHFSFDNLSTQKWLDGHRAGALTVAAWLNEKAIAAFSDGRDDEAFVLRKLAKDIVKEVIPKLDAASEQHEKDHPAMVNGKAKKR